MRVSFGGDEGDRTPYLLNAIQALSQVSYTPKNHVAFDAVPFEVRPYLPATCVIIAKLWADVNTFFEKRFKKSENILLCRYYAFFPLLLYASAQKARNARYAM